MTFFNQTCRGTSGSSIGKSPFSVAMDLGSNIDDLRTKVMETKLSVVLSGVPLDLITFSYCNDSENVIDVDTKISSLRETSVRSPLLISVKDEDKGQ